MSKTSQKTKQVNSLSQLPDPVPEVKDGGTQTVPEPEKETEVAAKTELPKMTTISVAAMPANEQAIVNQLLSQKPIVSTNMTQEEVTAVLGSAGLQPKKEETSNLVDEDVLIEALSKRIANDRINLPVVAAVNGIEPIPNEPQAQPDLGYMWDPHPAWGYAAIGAGAAGFTYLLCKLLGGK